MNGRDKPHNARLRLRVRLTPLSTSLLLQTGLFRDPDSSLVRPARSQNFGVALCEVRSASREQRRGCCVQGKGRLSRLSKGSTIKPANWVFCSREPSSTAPLFPLLAPSISLLQSNLHSDGRPSASLRARNPGPRRIVRVFPSDLLLPRSLRWRTEAEYRVQDDEVERRLMGDG